MNGLVPGTVLFTLLLAGCGQGGPPADLFVVERAGSVPGARLTLRLTDDGGAYCNDGARYDLTSDQLLEARELRRELDGDEEEAGLSDRGLRLPARPQSVFRYRVRSEGGVVAFADNSARQPEALARLQLLTRRVAKDVCGLVR